jgi:hypothetical protein
MRRLGVAIALAVLLAFVPVSATTGQPVAKKRKPPCDFKLARNPANHSRVKIKMTCHKKFVTNVRFTLRKKYTVKSFQGFPGGFCSVQSKHVAGCVFGGNGAPNGKAVKAVVEVLVPVPKHDNHFADVEIFLSGGDPIGEQLGY